MAWLLSAEELGFRVRAGIEGALLLDPRGLRVVGSARVLGAGRAQWSLGPSSLGKPIYVQGLALEGGRTRMTNLVRLDPGR